MRRLAAALLWLIVAAAASAQQADQEPLHISADNMTGSHSSEGDLVLLNGDVRISRNRTLLTADNGRYLRTQGMVFLEGNVKMVDSTTTVTCDHASYSENADVLELSGNVVMVDREATLEAPAATYDRRTGRAELYGGVHGRDGERTLVCDRAIYHRDSLLLQARGNVIGSDEKHRLELHAGAVDYDRSTHEALASGSPEMRVKDEDDREAVIRARRMRLNTETRVAEAIDSVRIVRDTLQASADYGLFDEGANRGWLLGHPRAWDLETTVSGDTLEMWTEDRKLKRVVVRDNAVMDYRGTQPSTLGEVSRLTGKRVDVYLTGQEIDSLVAIGGARDEYQGVPARGKTPEKNFSEGDTITVFFRDGKIDRARVEGKATGEYHLAVDVGDTLAEQRERVRYDATRISYIVGDHQILLDEDAHLTYQELELTAGRVEFDVDRQTLVARGEPELVDHGDKVVGGMMTYDLETRIGNIYKAETAYEQGLYHGQRIRKVSEKQLNVLNGSYTTCDLDQPHYHFAAHWMKIYLKDKLVAKPVVFYVKQVPLLALPFWIFPIKPGRHSGFLLPQIEFGFSNKSGQFFRNAGYYWAPNDYMDLTFSGDYYQFEPSWVVRAEGVYKLLYVLDGSFRGSLARNENPNAKREDWDFSADHSQEITPRTRLIARAQFVSSRDFNSSDLYGRSLYQRLNRFLTSSVAISHVADWASFNAVLDRRQDLDADESIKDPDGRGPEVGSPPGTVAALPTHTESAPNLSVTFPTRAIGSLGLVRGTPLEKPLSSLYFSLGARFVSQRTRQGVVGGYQYFVTDSTRDSTTFLDHRVTTRRGLAANTSLSDARRLFGWLTLRPSLAANMAVFDFDELGNRVVPTGTWSSSMTASATFYGTFQPNIGPLRGLRHVVFPSASFSYSPEFPHLIYTDSLGIRRDRFHGFSGIGVSGFKQFRMNFGLDQRLQAKLARGDKVRKLDNLLTWSMNGSYDFLYREHNLRHPLSNINSSVFLQPPGVVNLNLGWVTDVYSPRPVRSLGYNVSLNLSSDMQFLRKTASLPVDQTNRVYEVEEARTGENWSVDLAYSYSGGYAEVHRWTSNKTANAVARYQLTPNWSFDYSASYDVTNHEMGIQRFSLTRDLHCWQAIFTRTFAPGGEAEYYFRLGVKEQREIFIERGTRGGSLGGIQ